MSKKTKLTRKHRILMYLMQNGEAPLHVLRSPAIGGAAADVRIRELRREHGFDIDWYYKENADGEQTHTTIYKLKTSYHLIDLENLKVKKAA